MTSTSTAQKVSPMMAQWHSCKELAQNAILLFRMGDFYEAFHDDAILASKELDLTLTKRQGIPMAGVPAHTCDTYVDRLIAKGHRVAIAEQTEDPKQAKGLVKRELVRVVTPGTVIDSSLISDKANNFFVSVDIQGQKYGMAYLDLTTAEFRVLEFDDFQKLSYELYRLRPSEFLASKRFLKKHNDYFTELKISFDFLLNDYEDWHFDKQITYDSLLSHFNVHNLDGYGLRGYESGIGAAGALLQYLQDSLCLDISHIRDVGTYQTSDYLSLDPTTLKNLELTESLQEGLRKNTLLDILDKTRTPMGARLIKNWIKQPLLNPEKISQRQDAVEAFFHSPRSLEELRKLLDSVRDLERLMMKVCSGYAGPRDVLALSCSFGPIPQIKALLMSLTPSASLINAEANHLNPLPEMTQLINRALSDTPPARISDGNLIKDGYNSELDQLRDISRNGKGWIAQYQNNLREATGIKTLKVGYNRMFGYYIEVSKGQADKMPSSFERRQTLVNAERFISPELKDYESKVLSAEERISAIENTLFQELKTEVSKYAQIVMKIATTLAQLDVLQSLAYIARQHDYKRPFVDSSESLTIKDGRHPVIEASTITEKFVPNDTLLDSDTQRLLLITGPNMAGKSTYIRQVALITIMAQMGSFVPAREAHIGIIDKVFTRIGASDDLSRGQSTFMVEMTETANILHHATDRSLVILDEIGRGTSTYDGISIAWSVAEFLLCTEGKRAKTLFATHYWELTKLEEKVKGAVNYNVAVNESRDHIVFLRKIVKGSTDKSYGIHVGKLAGLPDSVIKRAREILDHLEENANRQAVFEPSIPKPAPKKKIHVNDLQMSFFEPK